APDTPRARSHVDAAAQGWRLELAEVRLAALRDRRLLRRLAGGYRCRPCAPGVRPGRLGPGRAATTTRLPDQQAGAQPAPPDLAPLGLAAPGRADAGRPASSDDCGAARSAAP